MKRTWRISLVALFLVTPLLAPGHAHAQSAPTLAQQTEARRLIRKGHTDYQLGRFGEALKAYERAFELHPTPTKMFNIAQCLRQLKDNDRALFSYERYLAMAPQAANRAEVQALIGELERYAQQRRVVRTAPPKSLLGGGETGSKATPPPAPAGGLVLAPTPGSSSVAPAATTAATPVPSAGLAPGAPGGSATVTQIGLRPTGVRRALLIAGGAATAAFLAMGIAGTAVKFQRYDSYNHNCVPPRDPSFVGPCMTYLPSGTQANMIAIAGYALAGTFALATLTVAFWPRLVRRPVTASASIDCTLNATGVMCAGRF
jgi:hypothetical protein